MFHNVARHARKLSLPLTVLASLALMLPASAQSAKNAVQISGGTLLPKVSVSTMTANTSYDGAWTPILSTSLHTSQQKDLVVGVSLQCGLFTDTLVSSRNGTKDTSTAEGAVEVRVLMDGVQADAFSLSGPGAVIFSRRAQTLMAKLGGIMTVDPVTGEITFTDEEIQLILDTTEANHFDWVLANVGAGDHTIEVQARISLKSNSETGSATAAGSVGNGALIVNEVRLVKDAVPYLAL